MSDLPETAVIGAGAVGSFFGGMLGRAGARVTFFGRPGRLSPHLESIRDRGLEIDGTEVRETVAVSVGELDRDLGRCELVLFAVKSLDTESAARGIRERLRDDAVVVSLQNGIDNVERLTARGIEALPTVVFVAAAIERPGAVRHRGRGDLIIGDPTGRGRAERVARWFESSGVPCPVSEDIRRDQWIKLTLNSMTNAISALTGSSYRRLVDFSPTWELALSVAREAVEVARAERIELDLGELIAQCRAVVDAIGDATSSTQQDIAAGRRTEIDALNGYIASRGAELGVPTPANDTLRALVKLRERLPDPS